MDTIFAKAILAQTYKGFDANGHVVGGPAYYITEGLGEKFRPMAVFFGGVARLAGVTEKIVPFMAAIYIVDGTCVIACHASQIIPAFALIFEAAFNPQAVMGGALGLTVAKAMQFGVARGLFSNEAGMGSTARSRRCQG